MDAFIGSVMPFTGNYAPKNWMLCNGQFIPIASNTALFSILGTTYGGNGTTNFALPDLRGRVVVGAGQGISFYNMGDTGGAEYIPPLALNQIPTHTHPFQVQITPAAEGLANSASPVNAAYAISASSLYDYTSDTSLAPYTVPINTTEAGSSRPMLIPSLHPVLAMSYIICTAGVFPQ